MWSYPQISTKCLENWRSCWTGWSEELESCVCEEEGWSGRLSPNASGLVKTLMLRGCIQQELCCSLLGWVHVAVGLQSRWHVWLHLYRLEPSDVYSFSELDLFFCYYPSKYLISYKSSLCAALHVSLCCFLRTVLLIRCKTNPTGKRETATDVSMRRLQLSFLVELLRHLSNYSFVASMRL